VIKKKQKGGIKQHDGANDMIRLMTPHTTFKQKKYQMIYCLAVVRLAEGNLRLMHGVDLAR
jgi:hypothetical protein